MVSAQQDTRGHVVVDQRRVMRYRIRTDREYLDEDAGEDIFATPRSALGGS